MAHNEWNARLYDSHHHFVSDSATALLAELDIRPGDRVLDLGCGTGKLMPKLREMGAEVIGVDSAPSMIDAAREACPWAELHVDDARTLEHVRGPVDAILSNAVLHWVRPPEAAVTAMARVLRPGGRLVLEMGGADNIRCLRDALAAACAAEGVADCSPDWYFPTPSEYCELLEHNGLSVEHAWHFARPTPLSGAEGGLRLWLQMFVGSAMSGWKDAARQRVLTTVEQRCRPQLWDGRQWQLDYTRLRVVARRQQRGVVRVVPD